MQMLESGMLDQQKKTIELDIHSLDDYTYDLIKKAFDEVLEQAGINPSKVWHEEWKLTCKYFEESQDA